MPRRNLLVYLNAFSYILALATISLSAQSPAPKSPKKKSAVKKVRFVVPKVDPNTAYEDVAPPSIQNEGVNDPFLEPNAMKSMEADPVYIKERRISALTGNLLNHEPSKYVNPFIGTGGHGHTFPGAVVPFGMVQLSPDTRTDASWDGCGGYYYHDSFIYGFSHTHLSGTGVSDFGDVLFQPITHQTFDPSKYRTTFSHTTEEAMPGYYKVALDKWNVTAEVTASEHVGMHRYSYQTKGDSILLVIDLDHRDQLLSYGFTNIANNRVEGFRQSKAWANNQWVFFCANFSRNIQSHWYNSTKSKLILYFGRTNDSTSNWDAGTLISAVGISFTDAKGAENNMRVEVSGLKDFGWPNGDKELGFYSRYSSHFNEMKRNAKRAWDKQLNKIYIPSGKEADLIKFYSALYHVCIHPSLASDVDLRYRGRDQQIHSAKHEVYSVFSLWDTYRALHPLLNIIEENRTANFINSFLLQYLEGGRLPVWELGSCETDCMIGYHSVSVISDAILQGISGIDIPLALKAMKHSSDLKESSYIYQNASIPQNHKIPQINLGYIDAKNEAESVSKSLEYAYNDYCIAQVCLKVNDNEGYNVYSSRSQRWINSLDPQTKFMRPRQNGEWLKPFDPKEVNNHFTEANSYQYSFYVPQDIQTYIQVLGGEKALESQLDKLFNESTKTTGREQSDISGLIGQYAHGNEPSHHMVYLYNYCHKPAKTQQLIQKIWNEFYTTKPDGLIGNEDCGQMSAWAVMSAMGIYAVSPISQEYDLGKPLFSEVLVNAGKHGLKYITAFQKPIHSASDSVYLTQKNGKYVLRISKQMWMSNWYLDYTALDFKSAGELTDSKFESLAGQESYRKYQIQRQNTLQNAYRCLVAVPSIEGERMFESDNHKVTLIANPYNKALGRTLMTKIKVKNLVTDNVTSYLTYLDTFVVSISQNSLIWAGSFEKNSSIDSPIFYSAAYFVRKPNAFKVQSIVGSYNKQYTAGGDQGVVNGLKGSTEWRAGEWQGFQNQDIEYVIDMGTKSKLEGVSARFLQDSRAWILFPTEVEFFISKNGTDFTSIGVLKPSVPPDSLVSQIWNAEIAIKPQKVQFIKVKAKTYGALPPWHQGAPFNGTAFIFIDEITPNLKTK